MNTEKYISVYRFRDSVAFTTETGHTRYLTPAMAEDFAKSLLQYVEDVRQVRFSKSKLTTTTIEE